MRHSSRHRAPYLPTLIAATVCSLGGRNPSSSDQLDLRSPAMKRLVTQLQAGTPDAEAAFFAGLTQGTPLVEPSPSANPAWSLVTFLWRGKPDTRRVTVMGGRPVTDWEAPLERLPGTDIWYRTEALPSDSRFIYTLTVGGRAEAPDRIEELLAEEDRKLPDPLTRAASTTGRTSPAPGSARSRTTCPRHRACAARTPWYLTRCPRGAGTSDTSFSMHSSAQLHGPVPSLHAWRRP